MKDGKPWIGDEVFDEDAKRIGIITDFNAGMYVMHPTCGPSTEWTNPDGDRLTVISAREGTQ
ncbi:hypothetical protein ACPYPG_21300 [Streptomyces sp. FR-108]|uniref:hypothetical protein n=1 Tax=Streptomyces sp. FR-108 TaxID=3416665 RepID=UPI003CF6DDCE